MSTGENDQPKKARLQAPQVPSREESAEAFAASPQDWRAQMSYWMAVEDGASLEIRTAIKVLWRQMERLEHRLDSLAP